MRSVAVAAAFGCVFGFVPFDDACAEVVINISKSQQQIGVSVNGAARYRWLISTGRRGYGTPTGNYRPQRLERQWFSRKYDMAPMPHAIFFHKGYAIHGTTEVARLGNVASHGCVRLHPANAATLFALVERQGMKDTRIVVSEAALSSPRPVARRLDLKPPLADEKPVLRAVPPAPRAVPQAPRVNPAESLSW